MSEKAAPESTVETWRDTCRPADELEPPLWTDQRINQTLPSFVRHELKVNPSMQTLNPPIQAAPY